MREHSQTTPAEVETPHASTSTSEAATPSNARASVRPRPAFRRAWRNAILGTLLVGCGLVVAVV
ncbi:MAG TPA: hypothetical protein VD835_02380, partial [Pyrinomonadaceae bacterium]|nr:hypothetical protein [Pyrinomonadaceae bacterium]